MIDDEVLSGHDHSASGEYGFLKSALCFFADHALKTPWTQASGGGRF